MTTARQLIKKAMQKAKILTKSEQPDNDEEQDALDSLNDLLSSWSTDTLMIYARTWETLTLTGGDGEYTIGTGADLNTAKPIKIIDAYVRSGTVDYPLQVINDKIYNSQIAIKDITGIPAYLNFDNNYPTSTIRLYPVPTINYTLHLLSEKELSAFAIDDDILLPAGWRRALIYNLAIDLAPEYGQPVEQVVYETAKSSLASIKRAITRVRSMDALPQMGNRGNIYSGWDDR